MKFSFINLGCKINQVEMEQAAEGLVTRGYEFTEDIEMSHFLLINTCTVTTKADKKSLQTIKKYSQRERLKHIFVTGCYSELEPDLANKVHPKNQIIAQRDKHRLAEIIDSLLKEEYGSEGTSPTLSPHIPASDRFSAFKLARVSPESMGNQQVDFFKHTRAFLKIQDGCNAFCSYCRIPYARGAPVSRSYFDILAHVDRLRISGVKEIVLSGINIGKYRDATTRTGFSQLLKSILDRLKGDRGDGEGEVRVKISSIEPFSLDDDFFDCIAHPNLAPHIHLPLQGLSDNILQRMNRHYLLSDYKKIVERIYRSRPDFSIATDVIVGYPGEREEDYQAGKQFLRECGISKIHVFPFSPRPFTEDYPTLETGDDLSVEIKKYRSQDLRNFSQTLERMFLERVSSHTQKIIIESSVEKTSSTSSMGNWYRGTTEYNLKGRVWIDRGIFNRGKCFTVKLAQSSPLIFHHIGE